MRRSGHLSNDMPHMRQSIAPLRRIAMQAATVRHPTLRNVAHARIAPTFRHVAHVRVLDCEKNSSAAAFNRSCRPIAVHRGFQKNRRGKARSLSYLRAARAYMLVSMPTGTSTISGVFQAMTVSLLLRYDRREKSNAASKAA